MKYEEKDYGIKKCPVCGEFFSKKNAVQVYCSTRCSKINAERKRAEKRKAEKEKALSQLKCKVCGGPLKGKQTKYCCTVCKDKGSHRLQKGLPLADKLQPPDESRYDCKRKEKCKYGKTMSGTFICDYLEMTGHSRGGYPADCTKYEPRRNRGPRQADWSCYKGGDHDTRTDD